MRFLFVVPPLVGHVKPTVSVGLELTRRGHEVAWVGHERAVRPLLPEGARFFALGDGLPEATFRDEAARAERARGLEALKLLWERFLVPLAHSMLPGVRAALAAFRPDVVIVDQQTLAGAVAAEELGVPWVTSATTAAGVTDPLIVLPKVREWLLAQQSSLFRDAGVAPPEPPDLSPRLVLVFSTEALAAPPPSLPPQVHFVGPALTHRAESTPFPWEKLDATRRLVLISLGTVPSDGAARFYGVVAEAFADEPSLQIVLVAPDGALAAPPPSFIVRPFVPQLALLARAQAVVSHAGQNTVSEALARGLPLVVLPIKYDQSVIAAQVESAGAGLRLKFGRVRADELRAAVLRVLGEPHFAHNAARIGASFEAAGGARAAAELLEAAR